VDLRRSCVALCYVFASNVSVSAISQSLPRRRWRCGCTSGAPPAGRGWWRAWWAPAILQVLQQFPDLRPDGVWI